MAQKPDAATGTDTPAGNGTATATPDAPKADPKRFMINIMVSKAFKLAVDEYATSHDTSSAALARKALADLVSYNLGDEPKRTRRTKAFEGLSKDQKAKAQKDARKARNDLIKKLLEGHEADLKAATMAAIEAVKSAPAEQPADAPAPEGAPA